MNFLNLNNFRKKYPKSIAGFTYIEIMVAVMIISYGLLAFYKAFLNSIISSKSSQYKTLAVEYASNDLEKVKSVAYANLVDYSESSNLNTGRTFNLTRDVTEITTNELKKVDTTVYWVDNGSSRTVTLSTYIANY